MKAIGNFIWFITLGWILGILYFLMGVLLCVTLIGIPFGIACFRVSKLAFLPFKKSVETNFDSHPVLNVIWMVLLGAQEAVGCAIVGALLCATVIGIPFGLQLFKLMKVNALPFGCEITKE